MLATIALLSPADQANYPKRPTLYEYEKRYGWKEKFKRMEKSVFDELNSHVSLEYQRLNQIADLAARGTLLHMVQALQSGRAEDLKIFTAKGLHDLWFMQRVERGLPTRISEEEAKRIEQCRLRDEREKTPEERYRERGLEKMWNFIKSKPPNYMRQVMAEILGSEEAAHEVLLSNR